MGRLQVPLDPSSVTGLPCMLCPSGRAGRVRVLGTLGLRWSCLESPGDVGEVHRSESLWLRPDSYETNTSSAEWPERPENPDHPPTLERFSACESV